LSQIATNCFLDHLFYISAAAIAIAKNRPKNRAKDFDMTLTHGLVLNGPWIAVERHVLGLKFVYETTFDWRMA
jgi:hypothetical protein